MKNTIAVLPGDGIGPEVVEEAVKVLKIIAKRFNHEFDFQYGLIGHQAIVKTGKPLPEETVNLIQNSSAILFGAIGDPIYDNNPNLKVRPEQGLLEMRKVLGLYANLRPVKVYSALVDQSPLKKKIIANTDFVVVRELIGGIYFGEKGSTENSAYDTCSYSVEEIIRVGRVAFELAVKRKNKVTLVDKANVLETSKLWRKTIQALHKDYPDVSLEMMYVDNAAMQIIRNPSQFDVILTENMFGDILTDEASVITGSIGMLPSASIGQKTALYEPIHGSYPQAVGKHIANPIGAILSAALLLDISFNLKKEAKLIEKAITNVLSKGFGTCDINSVDPVSTQELGKLIRDEIKNFS
ncbi:MAG: 3-isopropylmalate dehydrogenase [Patescibacteria group bacterium]|nr:MAG: 3-isopropylmalate dehydrogenase [Patescibacteria group bacterium]